MPRHWNRWMTSLAGLAMGTLVTAAAHAVPVVSFAATPSPATLGSTLTLDIRVTGAVDLFGWQLTLGFDPSKLQVSSVVEGSFLTSAGTTFYSATPDNAAGSIPSFDTLIGTIPGRTGDGVLERIVFNVTGSGTTAISFGDLLFLNSSLSDLGAVSTGGNVALVNGGITPPVPEPAGAALLAVGLAAIGLMRRASRRR